MITLKLKLDAENQRHMTALSNFANELAGGSAKPAIRTKHAEPRAELNLSENPDLPEWVPVASLKDGDLDTKIKDKPKKAATAKPTKTEKPKEEPIKEEKKPEKGGVTIPDIQAKIAERKSEEGENWGDIKDAIMELFGIKSIHKLTEDQLEPFFRYLSAPDQKGRDIIAKEVKG